MLQRGDGASAEATSNKEPYAVVQGGFFSSCQQVKVNANPDNFFSDNPQIMFSFNYVNVSTLC